METDRQFRDRTEAESNSRRHSGSEIDADIALAIPRGGLPLGRAVADVLDVPLDIVVAKKIGAPGNPEFAIGAVASDGSVWQNETAFRGTGGDEEYFEQQREEEAANARQKAERYRDDQGRTRPDGRDRGRRGRRRSDGIDRQGLPQEAAGK